MAHPAFEISPFEIHHTRQRGDHDCGIACLAMLTGQSYDSAHVQVTALHPRRWEHGITRLTMAQLLSARGFAMGERRKRCTAPVAGLNLLEVSFLKGRNFHWVVMTKDGTVHDPLEDIPVQPNMLRAMAPLAWMDYHRVRAQYAIVRWPYKS